MFAAATKTTEQKSSGTSKPGQGSLFFQPKLTVNQPGDEYEREADEMAERVMRMPAGGERFFKSKPVTSLQRKCAGCEREEKELLQKKEAGSVIQRQETADQPSPDFRLTTPSLLQPSAAPDYLSLRQPFFNRGIAHLYDADSAVQVWQYNFGFFRRFGLSDGLSASLTNFTAPRFIDSQLKAGNPLWWEITDRELNTSSFVGSIPVLEFNADFSPVAPSWVKTIFGGRKSVQRKEASQRDSGVFPGLNNYVGSLSSRGSGLPEPTRKFFEPRFGYDFSSVKIHNDAAAHASARNINALAYTHGNNIVFGSNQYSPESDSGKKLLAHELTHVVQQGNGIHLQSTGDRSGGFDVTQETIDLSHDDLLPLFPDSLPPDSSSADVLSIVPQMDKDVVIQAMFSSGFIQRNNGAPDPPRKDFVFMMGSTGGFYLAAKRFFKDHFPAAEIISLKDNSLAGIFSKLREVASDQNPVGNLYIVSHANVDGTLSFGIRSKDKDKKTSFGELRNALVTSPQLFTLSGGVDAKTKIHIKGCNIGRNIDMLNALDEAFGKKAEVTAPTHKQGYEYHTEKKGKDVTVISSEYFNTYNVEFAGTANKSDDELVDAFRKKYADLGFSDQDWEIAVLGTAKQGKKADKAAAGKSKEVDARLKANLAALDKTAADYKAEKSRLESEAKTEKADIAKEAKDAKVTVVAKGSTGAVKKVVAPFTATLFNDKPAPTAEKDILKAAPVWFAKTGKGGWTFLSASVSQSRAGARDNFEYTVKAENKEGRFNLKYTLDMAALPTSDADAKSLAENLMKEHAAKNPDFAVARRAAYDWRIDTAKKQGKITVTAFLEMTIYAIDLDFKEAGGAVLNPATKEGEEFYFGESDVKP
jgi:hypothetical protein